MFFKLVAIERRSFNIVPKLVLFPKIYIKICIFPIWLWKMTHLSVLTNFNDMNEEIKSIIIIMNFYRLIYFLKFSLYEFFHWYFSVSSIGILQSIKFVSYYNYKNRGFVQFVTIYNFIFYKCGRSTELQKPANEAFLCVFPNFSHNISWS